MKHSLSPSQNTAAAASPSHPAASPSHAAQFSHPRPSPPSKWIGRIESLPRPSI
ncbi:hypothetical protein Droror1_Dr00014621, partial [Drosera rotundifolia]